MGVLVSPISISHQAGVETYEYGKLGERVKETKHIDVGPHVQEFITGFKYDSWGRLHTLDYPDCSGQVILATV